MMDISDIQNRFATLIESRANQRSTGDPMGIIHNSPLRLIGENLLDKFSSQLLDQAIIAEQRENIIDEIIEQMVSSLVLAGMIGIDLESELSNLLSLLEAVSSEAS